MKIKLNKNNNLKLDYFKVQKLIQEELKQNSGTDKENPDSDKNKKGKIEKKPNFPMDFILFKFPNIKTVLTELLTVTFREYVRNIYVMAPKPTTFKVLLKNNQEFFIIYNERSYIVKIEGKKYYMLNLGERERAIKAVANLLNTKQFITSKSEDDEEAAKGPDKESDSKPKKSSSGGSSTPSSLSDLGPDSDITDDDLPPEISGEKEKDGDKDDKEEPLKENLKIRIFKKKVNEIKVGGNKIKEQIKNILEKSKEYYTENSISYERFWKPFEESVKNAKSTEELKKLLTQQFTWGVDKEKQIDDFMNKSNEITESLQLLESFSNQYQLQEFQRLIQETEPEEISPEEAADLIENSRSIFVVEFTKKDGSHRIMNCQRGVTKHLKGGSLAYDPAEKNLISVWDVEAAGYRMINKNTIVALRIGPKSYVVKRDKVDEIKVSGNKNWDKEYELIYRQMLDDYGISQEDADQDTDEFIHSEGDINSDASYSFKRKFGFDYWEWRNEQDAKDSLKNQSIDENSKLSTTQQFFRDKALKKKYAVKPQPSQGIPNQQDKQEVKSIDYFQQLLNQSSLTSQTRSYIQRIIDSIKSQGNLASSLQLSILQKLKLGQLKEIKVDGNVPSMGNLIERFDKFNTSTENELSQKDWSKIVEGIRRIMEWRGAYFYHLEDCFKVKNPSTNQLHQIDLLFKQFE